MRHFLPARPITALPRGVGQPAAAAGLIAAGGRALGLAPRLLRALGTAVDLAAIAPAAQGHLGATTGAQEKAGSRLQAALLGSRRRALDEWLPPVKYCPGTRAQRRVGAASVTTATLKGRPPRSFSTAVRVLPRLRWPCHPPGSLHVARAAVRRACRSRCHSRLEGAGGSAPRAPRKAAKKKSERQKPSPFPARRQISAVSDRHSQARRCFARNCDGTRWRRSSPTCRRA